MTTKPMGRPTIGATLTRQLSVLVSHEQYADLQAQARREGKTIGEIVRDALAARDK